MMTLNLELVTTMKSGAVKVEKFNNILRAQMRGTKIINALGDKIESVKLYNCRGDKKYLNSHLNIEEKTWHSSLEYQERFKEMKRRKNFLI